MAGTALLGNPNGSFPNSFSSYADKYPPTTAELQTDATFTGNVPIFGTTHATAPTGKVTPATTSLAAFAPHWFLGIANVGTGVVIAANTVVQVVTRGVVRNVPSTGTITAGQLVGVSPTSAATVAEASANDLPVIGYAINDAASNLVDVMVLGGGAVAGAQTFNGFTLALGPFSLAAITSASVEPITTYVPGYAGKITKFDALVTTPVTTGGDAASFNLEIGTTNVTGGVIALTSGNATPMGKIVEGSAITATNTFTPTDSISIEASSVTAFAEGAVQFLLRFI